MSVSTIRDALHKHLTLYYCLEQINSDDFTTTYLSKTAFQLIIDKSLLFFEIVLPNAFDKHKNEMLRYAEQLRISMTDEMKIMCYVLDWCQELIKPQKTLEFASSKDKFHILPDVVHDQSRQLTIYVWGRNRRTFLRHTIDHNFNACVLYGKKKGVDWTLDGRSLEIREAVMKCPIFDDFIVHMVTTIESKNCCKIGVNCRAGRHRSVTCAITMLHYYPESQIRFLEL